jgi:glycine oxidase
MGRAHPDVLVIGGGVIGLTTAYELARAGVPVTVLERGEFGREASWAGAGILPPGRFDRARSPLDRLRAFSVERYPVLSAELRELTGLDNGYRPCGGLEFPEDDRPIPTDAWAEEGIAFEWLDRAGLHRLEPALSDRFDGGYHFPGMGQVRNPWHLRALLAACERLGVKLEPRCSVLGFSFRSGRVREVMTDRGPRVARRFLVCGGAWTDTLLRPLGMSVGVRPVRGQMVLFDAGLPPVRSVLLVGKRYLVPRDDGKVLAGSTEEEVGFQKGTTPEAVEALRLFAVGVVPVLANVPVVATWSGLRPASADGLPVMGRLPNAENLFVSAGHFRAGIQLSPGSGRALADLLLDRPPPFALEIFRPGRPPVVRVEAAFQA